MPFKDEWIPQDDTMPADASVVNTIADEVIRIGENGGGNVDVVDNLNSTDTTKALSANQGRILETKKLDRGTEPGYVSRIALSTEKASYDDYYSRILEVYNKNGGVIKGIIYETDPIAVPNSDNLITSGVVYEEIDQIKNFVIRATVNADKVIETDINFVDIQSIYDYNKQIILRLLDETTGTKFCGLISEKTDSTAIWNLVHSDKCIRVACTVDGWTYGEIDFVTSDEFENTIGSIDTALDNIIQIQNRLMGVSE